MACEECPPLRLIDAEFVTDVENQPNWNFALQGFGDTDVQIPDEVNPDMSPDNEEYSILDNIFNPTAITSLVHRYRASLAEIEVTTGGTPSGLGDPVGFIPDEINSANLSASSSGQRPTLSNVSGITSANFDGLDDQMSASSGLLISVPYTVVAVFYWPGRAEISVYDPLWRLWAGSFATLSSQVLLDYDTTSRDIHVNNDTATYGGNLTDATPRWLSIDVMNSDTSSDTIMSSGETYSSALSVVHTDPTELLLGGINVSGRYYSGAIAELLIFNDELSAGERASINSYIEATYGDIS